MKIRQFIWERLRSPFVSGNGHVEYPETFHEELNDQCGRIIFVAALIATFAWLPYITIDRQLYPGEPFIVGLRIGLSLVGLTVLVLLFLKRFHRYNLLFLLLLSAYLVIATGLITGLTKADPAYLGGYLLVLTLLALVPIPRRAAWSILAVSLLIFFTAGFAKGMHFDSARLHYSRNDLLVTVLIAAFFIYLLDRLRFNSWEKSRKIEQQNESLKSDKAKIDELLHGIRLSEVRYRQLFDNSPVGTFLTTAEGKVLAANRSILELLKFNSVDAINTTGLPNLYVDLKDRTALMEKVKSGPVSGYETGFRRADDELISVSIGGYLVFDEEKKAYLMEGTIEDITKRKQAEEALRRSEEKYRLLTENSGDVIFTMDTELRVTYLSPAILKLTGFNPEEAMEQPIAETMTPSSLKAAFEEYNRVLPEIEKGKNPLSHIEIEQYRKDGSTVWVELSMRPIRDEAGRLIGFVGVARDISERKRAESEKEQAIEALRRSEEKYRLLTENSNDVIWTTDTDLRYTYYSPAVRKLRGLEPEEAMQKTLAETVTPASLNSLVSEYKRFLPDIEQGLNPTAVMEVEQYRKDGSTVWVEISMTTMRDDSGSLTGYVGVTRDISARKLAEEELQLRNILLSTQQEVSIDGILIVDENGAMISFNRRFVEIWDIPSDVVESKSDERALQSVLGKLIDPDEFIAKVRCLYENRTETSRDEIALKDGRILDRYSAPMLGDDGKYYGRIWYFRDITERKRTEAALQASEEKFRQIVSSIPNAVSMLDMNLRFTYVSAGVQRILGYTPEEAMTMSLDQICTPESLAIAFKTFQERLEANAKGSDPNYVLILELEEYHKNGSTVFLENTMTFLRDANGVPVGILCVSADITERKRAEAALQASKDAANAANQSKSIFLANMSHEIRTPMNAILGFAQLMQRDPKLSQQSREHIDIINRSGEHLLALINDILEMSKIEAGRMSFVSNTFDLHSLLNDLEMMFRVRTDAKKLRFLLEKVGDVPRWVITDEGKLRQILINLLGNAVKFTDEGGIALRLRAEAGKVDTVDLQFELEDTGPGMSEEEIGRLFQAFEQTKAGIKSGGTGLGLALSRGFVQIMGGTISATSAIGKGTTFRFEIPVREGKEEQTPLKEAKRRVLRLKPGQREIRVLIADDRETNRQLLSQLLAAVGFPIREVVNGEEAVRMVQEWKPQVVLMDMTMPVMDGYEATRKIKASPDIKNTAIIAVTASAFEEDKQRVFAAGADGYLSKPFKDAELFENIGRLTGAEYLYEETSGGEMASKTVDDTAAMRKSVAALPLDLVDQLRAAVESADIDRLNDLAGQLLTDHPTLAQRMQEMAARYEYEALIELFSPGA